MKIIKENIANIKEELDRVATSAGRDKGEVLLVAVTKTRTAEEINEAIAAGITDIGENKVQEILDKYEDVRHVNWHMIGHLQTNKVKYIIDKVQMIHSVDSYKLAKEINKRAQQKNIIMDVLIQVNAADEESKFGVSIGDAEQLVRDILDSFPNIRIKGLMNIAPYAEDPEDVRVYFKKMKELYDRFSEINHENLDFQYLSMGMSHDYKAAILEGSNLVRIGTAIFGERDYSK
ncbi:MAG: YggS family pyridoxal phosphate-dependent enzyme [Anaerovoracaceae bacterium]|jgi:pyridoxal phosphate enzyme (YggS family)